LAAKPLGLFRLSLLSLLGVTQLNACSESDRSSSVSPIPFDAGTDADANVDANTDAGVSARYPYYEDHRAAPENDLNWARCDLATEYGVAKNAAECANFEVPARRNVAGTKSLKLFIKRYRPNANVRGQLWIINGGPGAATSSLETTLDEFTAVGRNLEVYFLDHRGTGNSERLRCPEQEATDSRFGANIQEDEWSACAKTLEATWGDDLSGFNVTEAATDLGEAIARTRHGNEAVFLYSVSYGTYLAQRYLQVFPTQATGVVLDSICSPGACKLLLGYDRAFNATLENILSLCANDAECSTQVGTAPYQRLVSVASSLDNEHCSALGWSRTTLRQVMGVLTMYVGLRDYIPAVIKRVDRCSDNDVSALKVFQKRITQIATTDPTFSQPLSINISLSELSERPLPNEKTILNNVEELYGSVDSGPRMAGAVNVWPTYGLDNYYGEFAVTDTPLLMLNGTLDPQTPLDVATPTGEHFTGAYQSFIRVPYAAHTTLTQSPVDTSGNTCGAELIRQFFDDPTASLNKDCLNSVLPIDFSGNTAGLTETLFGTTTPFADTPPATATLNSSFGTNRFRTTIERARFNTVQGLRPNL
jgi:pimeloyl-ACP methyl ester carboxylesterase